MNSSVLNTTGQETHFIRVEFRFKAFERFTLHVRSFNILVGPNNAGESTVLTAFRILSAALRRAHARKSEYQSYSLKNGLGYNVDLESVSVAEEDIFYNYDDSEPASVTFHLSNGARLTLYFQRRERAFYLQTAPEAFPRVRRHLNRTSIVR